MADFMSILESVAPSIATALAGPFAGTAVSAIESALGVTPAAGATLAQRQSDLESKIVSATPQDLLNLKQADNAHAEAMAKLGFDNQQAIASINQKYAELDIDDRASARNREVSVKDKLPGILAVFITVGFFGILVFMLQNTLPVTNKDVLNIMLGSLGTAWISVVAYYFGSSAGSAQKTELLAKAPAIVN